MHSRWELEQYLVKMADLWPFLVTNYLGQKSITASHITYMDHLRVFILLYIHNYSARNSKQMGVFRNMVAYYIIINIVVLALFGRFIQQSGHAMSQIEA